jgi:hypothetical protein
MKHTLCLSTLRRAAGVSVIVAAATVTVAGAARSNELRTAPSRADAVQAFMDHRYAVAYGRFAQLADEGDAASALMALTMVCQGRSVFGSDWSATPGQLRRWSAAALQQVQQRGVVIPDHDRGE